ncbi:MAG TPA: hypothetical protein VHC04_17350 [Rhodopila sp.]|nr:hypothetical protein [Rhodopila sp.]
MTLLAGCTTVLTPGAPPVVIQSTPFGSTVIAGGGQAGAPPANLDPDLPGTLPAMGGPRDGIYSGVAVPLSTGGGMCINTQTIDQFRVEGDRVRWGLFRGRIQGNSLQMVQGNTWFFGTFDGNRFNGQITVESRRMGPSCTFMVALAKTGSL